MRNFNSINTALIALTMCVILSPTVSAQTTTSRAAVTQTRNLIMRLETNTDQLRRYTETSLNRSPINNSNREDRINDFITDFENATDSLRNNFDARQNIDADIRSVLDRGLFIDRFMTRNRLSVQAQNQWTAIRTDLNTLGRLYRVSWNWNQIPDYNAGIPASAEPVGRPAGGGANRGFDSRLTGTYRLNRSQSDDINIVLSRYETGLDATQRDRIRRNMERRLTSPEMLAIEKTGRSVTLASGLSPQVTFEADGVPRSETTRNGRTIRTTASANRDSLLISYEGDRANDFYLTFTPTRDGQLRVTRKLYLENQNETVSLSSVYDKTNNVAQWSSVDSGAGVSSNTGTTGTSRDFYIPNGTRLTATLRNMVNTEATIAGDRFTMEVVSPSAYRGSVIEGRIATAERSGRVSGRASLSFEFDAIRTPSGDTYRFAGNIDSVRTLNGDPVRTNNEGTVRDGSQTTRTATRAGIGAALGALIGAVAGGGQGAAVGAAVGAGAGAGTVFIQGRDNIELAQGTEFSITASAPNNIGSTRNY